MNIPSFQVTQGDKISWTERGSKTSLHELALNNCKSIAAPHWISLDQGSLETTVLSDPMADDGELVVDTVQIVEFYSK